MTQQTSGTPVAKLAPQVVSWIYYCKSIYSTVISSILDLSILKKKKKGKKKTQSKSPMAGELHSQLEIQPTTIYKRTPPPPL